MKSVYWISLLAVALSACQGSSSDESKFNVMPDTQLLANGLDEDKPECQGESKEYGSVSIENPILNLYIKRGEGYANRMKIQLDYSESTYWKCAPKGIYERIGIDFELVCNGKTVMSAKDYFGYPFAGGVTNIDEVSSSQLVYSTGIYWNYIEELFAPDTLCDIFAVPYSQFANSSPFSLVEKGVKGEAKKATVNFIYE